MESVLFLSGRPSSWGAAMQDAMHGHGGSAALPRSLVHAR